VLDEKEEKKKKKTNLTDFSFVEDMKISRPVGSLNPAQTKSNVMVE
jgi:hypothetical protein